jgi:cysteine synthase A
MESLRACLAAVVAPTVRKHESVVSTIGRTPLIKLQRMAPEGVNVYVKAEAFNPGGSVKDRLALGVIEWAEAQGQLKPGQTVIEASSGNTGIGLATVCAAKGYPFVCVMSEAFSIERRKLMRFLGAKVVLTNPAHKGTGMVIKAEELAAKHGWFLPRQFDNEANAWIHATTTGPEILEALGSERLDHFVTGYGTGGTLNGVSRFLKERSPHTQVHACEPDNAPMLFSGVDTTYGKEGAPKTFEEPHPVWRPHLLQGWAPDWVPKLVDEARGRIDCIRHVGGDAAMRTSRELAQKEGLLTGTSGGGCVAVALELAKSQPAGATIVAMLPDTGERYLSTPLFDAIPADMTDEEKAIDATTPSTPPPGISLPPVSDASTAFVKETIGKTKIVIWSLEYCEFCWTIVKFFDTLGIEYKRIDIDSFELAKDNQGNKYRAALQAHTECVTFPQFFVDGTFHGGAADACLKWKKGELQNILQAAGVVPKNDYRGDPFEFLPKWMTKNPMRSK